MYRFILRDLRVQLSRMMRQEILVFPGPRTCEFQVQPDFSRSPSAIVTGVWIDALRIIQNKVGMPCG